MSGEVFITVRGRLTADPELRFIASGSPVCSFSVAHNSRKFNKSTNEWEDTEATFYRCSLWGGAAENVAHTLRKGSAVIVHGVYGSRSWDAGGEKKTAQELKVETIGLDLTFYKVDPEHVTNSVSGRGQAAPQAQSSAPAGGSDNDPWAASAPAGDPPF
jgi:single-strand DNA-binding protein